MAFGKAINGMWNFFCCFLDVARKRLLKINFTHIYAFTRNQCIVGDYCWNNKNAKQRELVRVLRVFNDDRLVVTKELLKVGMAIFDAKSASTPMTITYDDVKIPKASGFLLACSKKCSGEDCCWSFVTGNETTALIEMN